MKKQLFSFLMVLALVVLAGTSAMAQNDADANTSTETYVMITGSTHTFSTTRGRSGSTLAWTVAKGANGSGDASGEYTVTGATDGTSFQITWDEDAAGIYTIQVSETNPAATDGCSTIRRFYVNVLDFDVMVYVSDANGEYLGTADVRDFCGDGTTANYGNEDSGAAFNNTFNSDGTLDGYTGTAADDRSSETDGYTERYVSLAIVWNTGIDAADIPTIGAVAFGYTATVNHGLINVNAVASTGAGSTYTANVKTPTTVPSGVTGTYSVFTIPITFEDRWFASTVEDITCTFSADDVALNSEADNSGSVIGREPASKQIIPATAANPNSYLVNEGAQQTIFLAPATTPIKVSQN